MNGYDPLFSNTVYNLSDIVVGSVVFQNFGTKKTILVPSGIFGEPVILLIIMEVELDFGGEWGSVCDFRVSYVMI